MSCDYDIVALSDNQIVLEFIGTVQSTQQEPFIIQLGLFGHLVLSEKYEYFEKSAQFGTCKGTGE